MFCQNILGDLAKYMERELALVFIGRNKTNDVTCYPNKLFENNFKLHGQENYGREGMVMSNEVFKNQSNDCISNIKESVEKSNRQKIELLESFEGKIDTIEKQIEYLSCKETMLCKETRTEACLNKRCDECRKRKRIRIAHGKETWMSQ